MCSVVVPGAMAFTYVLLSYGSSGSTCTIAGFADWTSGAKSLAQRHPFVLHATQVACAALLIDRPREHEAVDEVDAGLALAGLEQVGPPQRRGEQPPQASHES